MWIGPSILGSSSFVVNRLGAAGIALAAVVGVLLVTHLVIVSAAPTPAPGDPPASPVAKRRHGVRALVIGADGRASTSKIQVVMWTLALIFAFVFLLAWGRSTACGDA